MAKKITQPLLTETFHFAESSVRLPAARERLDRPQIVQRGRQDLPQRGRLRDRGSPPTPLPRHGRGSLETDGLGNDG